MKIEIKYNENIDEFTLDLSLVMRLRNYINRHFYPAYVIAELAPIYLVGGAIRDLIYAKIPKDMDFVVLGKEQLEWVEKVLRSYQLNPTLNRFGGFKLTFEDTKIDLWVAEDLFSSMQYNVDGIYFDIRTNSLLSLTFDDFCRNGLNMINPENNIEKGREKKLQKFENQYLMNYTKTSKKY